MSFCLVLSLRFAHKTILDVVIDQSDRLHIGVAGGGAHEFEATFFEVFGERVGFGGVGGVVG